MGDLNFKSNSDASKERTPKPKIVSCEVKSQTDTKMGKLKSIFIAEDVANVRDWVWNNAIVPNVKTGLCDLAGLIGDILTNSFCMMVTGTPSRNVGARNRVNPRNVNYSGFFVDPQTSRVEPRSQAQQEQSISARIETNFIFPTKADAELVLQSLMGDLQEYLSVSVADLYDAIGRSLPADNWQAQNVGWTDLSSAYIHHAGGGWILELPRVKRL